MAVYGDTLDPGCQVLVLCQHLLQTVACLQIQTNVMHLTVAKVRLI